MLRVPSSNGTARPEWSRCELPTSDRMASFCASADQVTMHSEGQPGCFTVTCKVLPGTHHIRFLVDGQMLTSPDLPTTVDYGNNLVNYIEIAIDGPDGH